MRDLLKKITFILTNQDKKKLVGIFFMMLLSAAFDLVGISAILPVVTLLTSGARDLSQATIDSNIIIKAIYYLTGQSIHTIDVMAYVVLGLFGIFYIVKTAYAFLYTYVRTRFTMNISRRLTKRQMETYLSMPYEYHLNNNSSTLIRKCTYDVGAFNSAVTAMLDFVIKTITMIAIATYLFITDWIVMLIVGGAMLIFSIFIICILKPHIRKIAKKNQALNSLNYKYMSQAFNGIKESKISNTERFFINSYDGNIKAINSLSLRNTMYSTIPSLSLELVGMFGLICALVVIIAVQTNKGISTGVYEYASIIEKFAVFAYATLKLLPCVTSINATINNFAWYKVSVDSIYRDINEAEALQESREFYAKNVIPLTFENEIKVNNLTFAYSSVPDKNVLKNVSCTIKKNTSVAFSGASGAGKTTMIDNVLGLLEPQEGNITVDGVDIKSNMKGWRTNISYIPQVIYLMDDTIRRNIAFGLPDNKISDEQIWDALEKAQLKEFVQGLEKGLNTIIGERGVRLSGGQRQRIGIARAFYRNTNVVVFDEATSALDYETEKNILDHVNKYASNHTLIIITHRLNTIETCDHIYKVEDSKLTTVK